jgi:hypothetical protein
MFFAGNRSIRCPGECGSLLKISGRGGASQVATLCAVIPIVFLRSSDQLIVRLTGVFLYLAIVCLTVAKMTKVDLVEKPGNDAINQA